MFGGMRSHTNQRAAQNLALDRACAIAIGVLAQAKKDVTGVGATVDVAVQPHITGPEGMDLIGAKVGETVALEVSAFGSDNTMPAAANPCNPCGDKGKNPCGGKESRTHARR